MPDLFLAEYGSMGLKFHVFTFTVPTIIFRPNSIAEAVSLENMLKVIPLVAKLIRSVGLSPYRTLYIREKGKLKLE